MVLFCSCAPNCPLHKVKDGVCHKRCNTTGCNYDGGDCAPSAELEVIDEGLEAGGQAWNNYMSYTNGILSVAYGMKNRWYPHHLPSLMDKTVMKGKSKQIEFWHVCQSLFICLYGHRIHPKVPTSSGAHCVA